MSKPTSRTLSSDHAATAETLSAILQKELAFARYSCKGYLNPSDATIITAADRKELVDWCYGIVDHYHLPREIVATAMEMVDRFLSISAGPSALWNINSDVAKMGRNVLHCKSKFQLLTVAALSNSTFKLKNEIMTSDEFAEAYSIYTPKEIEIMTYTLLRGLSWRSNTPTACKVGHVILSLLRNHVNLPEATWGFLLDKMEYQTELAVRDYYFSTQRPSTIAMAAISNAIESITSKAHQNMLRTCLWDIYECFFGHDQPEHIDAAQRRLQHHLRQGDIGTIIQDSTKISKLESLDNHVKTFPTNSEDKKMPPVAASTAATVSPDKDMKKPKRPLTAFHIYLAIESEYIVQSIPGEDADKSIHDGKVYLDYVPERYRQTKLSPEWYFGPGKRRNKRRHRKQHGKVSFQELSRMISSRWAKLDETHPDIKRFVQNLAERELMEYQLEKAEYEKQMRAITAHNAPVFSESKKSRKRVRCGDTESGDNTPIETAMAEFNVHSIVETAGEKGLPVKPTTWCQSSETFSNDLRPFHYQPVTKHQKNKKNITSTNIADCKADEDEGETFLRRNVSWKEDPIPTLLKKLSSSSIE
jgi:hypothetical protein